MRWVGNHAVQHLIKDDQQLIAEISVGSADTMLSEKLKLSKVPAC